MRILLITPPMVQVNAPYPATPYLTAFLRSRGIAAAQADASLALALRLFSRAGLQRVARELARRQRGSRRRSAVVRRFQALLPRYCATVEPALRFLQGRDPALAYRLAGGTFLPEGRRFRQLGRQSRNGAGPDPLAWAFGSLGVTDRARYLASLYFDDLADIVREAVDARFAFARYAESLAARRPSFAPLDAALRAAPTLIDRLLAEIARELQARHRPDLVGFTIPFPGALYGALRMARALKRSRRPPRIVLGGGYVNTELRRLSEPRLFDYVDYVVLDDGPLPLLRLIEHLRHPRRRVALVRTWQRAGKRVVMANDAAARDLAQRRLPPPVYDGLPLRDYFSLIEMPNPMQRLWSETGWTKLLLAHGCYWRRCRFCDTALDHIRRYDPATIARAVDRIEAASGATGSTGFHFVDEALAPGTLRRLADELLARGLAVSWWGNIRFEKAFTPALAAHLARAGCLAVAGGLETAEARTLALMNKGIDLSTAARVARAFANAGVMVHTYLMYGFPSQTARETVEGLEYVRQLFALGYIQSGFWHRFALTAHSPIAAAPAAFGIRLRPPAFAGFAENEIEYDDPFGADPALFGAGLRKALYNYMHGIGLAADVRSWFDVPVPRPRISRTYVARLLLNGRRPIILKRAERQDIPASAQRLRLGKQD